MRCIFCEDSGESHVPYCPSLTSEGSPERQAFERGRRAGRARRIIAEPGNPAYRMGWVRGDAAADAADEHAYNLSYL